MTPLPFHIWKDEIVKKDSMLHGIKFYRERCWYHSAYGRYCLKFNSQLKK